jgi:hypothetical protein
MDVWEELGPQEQAALGVLQLSSQHLRLLWGTGLQLLVPSVETDQDCFTLGRPGASAEPRPVLGRLSVWDGNHRRASVSDSDFLLCPQQQQSHGGKR